MTKLIPVAEWASKNDITPSMGRKYCAQGRIKGAKKVWRDSWLVPPSAAKPERKVRVVKK